MPGVEERQVVLADEKENCGVRGKGVGKMFEGEDGVGGFGAADFAVGDGEARERPGRQFAHPQPMLRRGGRVERAMDRGGGWDEVEAVESEMAAGVLGGDEVPEMDRVERAAQDADARRGHARQYGMGGGECQAQPSGPTRGGDPAFSRLTSAVALRAMADRCRGRLAGGVSQ